MDNDTKRKNKPKHMWQGWPTSYQGEKFSLMGKNSFKHANNEFQNTDSCQIKFGRFIKKLCRAF
jgi:hypothetical protein